MMAGRKPEPEKPAGLDATIPSLLYYGVYAFFFGKMILVIIERVAC